MELSKTAGNKKNAEEDKGSLIVLELSTCISEVELHGRHHITNG